MAGGGGSRVSAPATSAKGRRVPSSAVTETSSAVRLENWATLRIGVETETAGALVRRRASFAVEPVRARVWIVSGGVAEKPVRSMFRFVSPVSVSVARESVVPAARLIVVPAGTVTGTAMA